MNQRPISFKKFIFFCLLICPMFFLNGCTQSTKQNTVVEQNGSVIIGSLLEVKNEDTRLSLLDHKDVLAADGLYYAAWAAGNSEPYENADGDTVDLYDAQLYLLLGEAKNPENAQHDQDTWLAAAKENYEIQKEETVSYNGQDYTLLTYRCKGSDTPYDRGVSAFGTYQNAAICIELTCRKNYSEDLGSMMNQFLNSCRYGTL